MTAQPSFLLQVTVGLGSPEVAQVSWRFSFSLRMTGLTPPMPLLLILGGSSSRSSLEQPPLASQAQTPGLPASPCLPSSPSRPRGPGRPRSP